jgi:CMP-N-acetylneuraminic acid synthetase
MSVLAIIPARGGSKGIPRKNIRLLAGRPLIAWTIDAALAADCLDRVVVSTDDPEIAEIAESCGAEVPFLRPAELATDATPGVDPVLHALSEIPGFDWCVLLQPTSPLRTPADIDGFHAACVAESAPAAISVTRADFHPDWTFGMSPGGRLQRPAEGLTPTRRQDLSPMYTVNGALYMAATEWLQHKRSFLNDDTLLYEMPRERSIDIDDDFDWLLADLILQKLGTRN